MARHHIALHRLPRHRARGASVGSIRASDLILALLSVVLLGGLALAAAVALTLGSRA
jgi:hypothetical protein